MKCNKDQEFVINDGYIEKRWKHEAAHLNPFIFSICCRKCLPELKATIKKYEKELKK
jgi:hypothetical protein